METSQFPYNIILIFLDGYERADNISTNFITISSWNRTRLLLFTLVDLTCIIYVYEWRWFTGFVEYRLMWTNLYPCYLKRSGPSCYFQCQPLFWDNTMIYVCVYVSFKSHVALGFPSCLWLWREAHHDAKTTRKKFKSIQSMSVVHTQCGGMWNKWSSRINIYCTLCPEAGHWLLFFPIQSMYYYISRLHSGIKWCK